MNNRYNFGAFEVQIDLIGAQMISAKYDDKELLHPGDDKFWGRSAPVLFPNVGRYVDNTYMHNGELFTLGQHGFLRDSEFKLLEHSQDEISFIFSSNEQTRIVYPFDFEFILRYKFFESSFITSYEVTNTSAENLLYNVGAHPAFMIDTKKSYRLELSKADKKIVLDPPYVSKAVDNTQTVFEMDRELFAQDAIIFEVKNHDTMTLVDNKSNQKVLSVTYKDALFVGAWQPFLDECPFICIEPWWGITDYANRADNLLCNKPHVLSLAPGKNAVHSFEIKIY